MNLRLETERLIIDPLSEKYCKFILKLLNSEGWIRFIGDRNVKDENDALVYIRTILDNRNYSCNVFKIKETEEPIGILTFILRYDANYPDIGFAMLPEYEKRGYAFEAARIYLDEIAKTNKYEKIIGITDPENAKSIRLLEKLGLVFQENFTRDNEELSMYCLNISQVGNLK